MPPEDERAVDQAESEAAEEAAEIGGKGSNQDLPPEEQPVAEAGGGESEGFEDAEELLVEHASHGDAGPDPTHMAGEAEEPEAAPDSEYGEADDARTVDP